MSAKHYFPDSSCRCPDPPHREPAPAPRQGSLRGCSGGAGGVGGGDDDIRGGGGGSDAGGGGSSLPISAVTTHRFAYHPALQNDL